MIIFDMSRKSKTFRQLANYIWSGSITEDQEQPSVLFRYGVEGKNPYQISKAFYDRELIRQRERKNSLRLFHTVLSWSKKDHEHLTDAMLEDIAFQFVSGRCPDGLSFGAVHRNTDEVHLHLMTSALDSKGNSISMRKKDFQKLKESLWAHQRQHYPLIQHSYDNKHAKERGFDKNRKKNHKGLVEMIQRNEEKSEIVQARNKVINLLGFLEENPAMTSGMLASKGKDFGIRPYLTEKRKQHRGFWFDFETTNTDTGEKEVASKNFLFSTLFPLSEDGDYKQKIKGLKRKYKHIISHSQDIKNIRQYHQELEQLAQEDERQHLSGMPPPMENIR